MTTRDRAGSTHSGSTVLAFLDAFEPGFKAGGPIRSMAATLDGLGPETRVLLVTRDRDLGDTAPYPGLSGALTRRRHHRVFYMNPNRVGDWLRALRYARAAHADVLWVSGLWSVHFSVLPILAHASGILRSRTLVIAPRGQLSSGALSLKRRKKRIARALAAFLLRPLRPTFLASAPAERADTLRAFPWAKVITFPDSHGPEPMPAPGKSSPRARLIHVSRVSPMKNLVTALEALMTVTEPLDFTIVGPVEDAEYWARCEALIRALPSNIAVTHHGPATHETVLTLFAQHDAFVFPTLGENFGHVVLESLSAGCPVVVSDRTPWTDLARDGGGIAIEGFDPLHWADAVREFARSTPRERTRRKQEALSAYVRWRETLPSGTDIDHVLRSAGAASR